MNTKISRSSGSLLLLAAAALFSPALAQTIYPFKLNQSLGPGENVESDFQISPDGSRVLYRADVRNDEQFELFSVVPVEGAIPNRLNDPLVSGGDVESFQISMVTGRAIYLADQDANDRVELYSVPIGGGTPVKINGTLLAGGDVQSFRISPDGRRVVYRANQDTRDEVGLYSVASTGGTPVKLNAPLIPGGFVYSFHISPDSNRVVYVAAQDVVSKPELYSVPIAGGVGVKLSDPTVGLGLTGSEDEVAISPDGSRVVYQADQDADPLQPELYSVPIGGGTAPVMVNGPLPSSGVLEEFQISPDSSWVVYRVDEETFGADIELYSVPIGGGSPPARLTSPFLPPGAKVLDFQISPDSHRVVFSGDAFSGGSIVLASVPITGGTHVRVSGGAMVFDAPIQYQLTPDGAWVVYRGYDEGDFPELYCVPIAGGSQEKLNEVLVDGGEVSDFEISPDGGRVVYAADQEVEDKVELFSVPLQGGSVRKLNGPLVFGGDVSASTSHPDSRLVAYRADQDTDGVFELYLARAQALWKSEGGNWFSGENWRDGAPPDPLVEAVIMDPAVVRLSSPDSPAVAEALLLGGSVGQSVLELVDGSTLALPDGAVFLPGGVLRGDGVFSVGDLPLDLSLGAEVRVGAGNRLAIQSGALTNAGSIEAFGTSFVPAEIEFSGGVTTAVGTGAIVGHDAIFRFADGLVNEGALSFGSGINDVQGDVTNERGGSITVSGGASAVFYEDVQNDGAFNVTAAGGLSSTAVFFGSFAGDGISGGGHVFLEGDTRPGASPGTMAFGGEVSFGPLAELEIELGGTEAGVDYDQVTVAGHLSLAGALRVTLIDRFVPEAGMVFDVWGAGSVSGSFASLDLPVLPAGLFWHIGEVHTTGELSVAVTPEGYPAFEAFYQLTTRPDGDQEGDGLANLLEYVTGRNPLRLDAGGPIPSVAPGPGSDRIGFVVARPGAQDAIVALETSTTLEEGGPGGWEVIARRAGNNPWTGSVPIALIPAGAGLERITVLNPNGDPKRFYRLRATLQP